SNFFFQAEDGIRDFHVTGVQKCALPIFTLSQRTGSSLGLEGAGAGLRLLFLESIVLQRPGEPFTWERPPLPHQAHPGLSLSGERSEERRVGKESRVRDARRSEISRTRRV